MTIIVCLRAFLNDARKQLYAFSDARADVFAEIEAVANRVISFYAAEICDEVGNAFKEPSLNYLADYWLDESNEVRQAARLLFGAALARLSNAELLYMVEHRQGHMLNSSRPSPKDLLITGEIAISRSGLLSAAALRDIANHICASLDAAESPNLQITALELVARGFNILQHHCDAVTTLRHVFKLASQIPASSKDSSTIITTVRNLARHAILAIAAVNAPLFMSVLSFDAVQTNADPEERAASMRLIAFMIKKVRQRCADKYCMPNVSAYRNQLCYLHPRHDSRKPWSKLLTREARCVGRCNRLRPSF